MRRPYARWLGLVLMIAGCSLQVDHTSPPITIGETSSLGDGDPNNGNFLVANRVILSETATLKSLSIDLKAVGNPAGYLTMALYDDGVTEPGSLRATTASIAAAAGWNSADVTSAVSLPAGTYWLAVTFSLDGIIPAFTRSSGTEHWVARTYDGHMPAAFPSDSFSDTGHFAFYATLQP